MIIENASGCQTFCLSVLFQRFLAFPEPEYQINQPSDKGNHGNNSPECFLSDGPEILAYNVNYCQYRQQVEHHTYFYPENCSCRIQLDPFWVSIHEFKMNSMCVQFINEQFFF